MEQTLLVAGLVCVIAAVVGGGLKAFGTEVPALQSVSRQVVLGVLGVALLAVLVAIRWTGDDATETAMPAADPPAPAATSPAAGGGPVAEAQQLLGTLGYYAGPRDGFPGPRTIAAIKTFQRENGLPEDGVIGSQTLLRMREAAAERPAGPRR